MNHSIIRYILFKVLELESLFLFSSCIVALIYKEPEGFVYGIVAVVTLIAGILGTMVKPNNHVFYAKEGFVTVALSWLILAIVGALPLWLTGEIPHYIDALFETVSGFTTTGSSILTDVEALSYCSLFWRSFTHWIGGMGVLVFVLAVTPLAGGNNMHIMRAESPGPSVGKLVPKIKQTASILYIIYIVFTILQIILLVISGMPLFDSITMSFGTAGTGGFGIKNSSIADYPMASQGIITVFMILFGVNFSVFYLLLLKKWKEALRCEEVRYYLLIIFVAILLITLDTREFYGSLFETIHHVAFQVGTIITTTGYATTDFNLWPSFSKTILVILMFIGACAGSTGGGLKVSRIITYLKVTKNEILMLLHPNRVKSVQLEGKPVSSSTLRSMHSYLAAFTLLFMGSLLLVSLDGYDFTTNFTAVAATINNIGPGLNVVGPTGNFSSFSEVSKVVFIVDMLIGRLEIFPILVLFSPVTWRNSK